MNNLMSWVFISLFLTFAVLSLSGLRFERVDKRKYSFFNMLAYIALSLTFLFEGALFVYDWKKLTPAETNDVLFGIFSIFMGAVFGILVKDWYKSWKTPEKQKESEEPEEEKSEQT